jgi:hypothetical protein
MKQKIHLSIMNSTNIDRLRNKVANSIVRLSDALLPRDENDLHIPPFRSLKHFIARQLHRLYKSIAPKADYNRIRAESLERMSQEIDAQIAKLKSQ